MKLRSKKSFNYVVRVGERCTIIAEKIRKDEELDDSETNFLSKLGNLYKREQQEANE